MISDPTRITMNSHTLLDIIETNSPELFRNVVHSILKLVTIT